MVHKRKDRGWTDKNTQKCKIIGDRAGAYVWLCNHTYFNGKLKVLISGLFIVILKLK